MKAVIRKPEDTSQHPKWIESMDVYDGFVVELEPIGNGLYKLIDQYILFHPDWFFEIGSCDHSNPHDCYKRTCDQFGNSSGVCWDFYHTKCKGTIGKNDAGLAMPCLCVCHYTPFIYYGKVCDCDSLMLSRYGHSKGCDYHEDS